MFKTILAAVDQSSQRHVVLEQAAEIAQRFGADLHVVSVRDLMQNAEFLAAEANPDVVATLDADTDALLAEAENEVAKKQVACVIHRGYGTVVEQITLMVEATHADLLVVGHRHLSWLRRMAENSVGTELLRSAPCSLLVVVEKARDSGTT